MSPLHRPPPPLRLMNNSNITADQQQQQQQQKTTSAEATAVVAASGGEPLKKKNIGNINHGSGGGNGGIINTISGGIRIIGGINKISTSDIIDALNNITNGSAGAASCTSTSKSNTKTPYRTNTNSSPLKINYNIPNTSKTNTSPLEINYNTPNTSITNASAFKINYNCPITPNTPTNTLRTHCSNGRIGSFSCRLCGFRTTTKKYLNRHLRRHDKTANLQCLSCPYLATTAIDIKEHLQEHEEEVFQEHEEDDLQGSEGKEQNLYGLLQDDEAKSRPHTDTDVTKPRPQANTDVTKLRPHAESDATKPRPHACTDVTKLRPSIKGPQQFMLNNKFLAENLTTIVQLILGAKNTSSQGSRPKKNKHTSIEEGSTPTKEDKLDNSPQDDCNTPKNDNNGPIINHSTPIKADRTIKTEAINDSINDAPSPPTTTSPLSLLPHASSLPLYTQLAVLANMANRNNSNGTNSNNSNGTNSNNSYSDSNNSKKGNNSYSKSNNSNSTIDPLLITTSSSQLPCDDIKLEKQDCDDTNTIISNNNDNAITNGDHLDQQYTNDNYKHKNNNNNFGPIKFVPILPKLGQARDSGDLLQQHPNPNFSSNSTSSALLQHPNSTLECTTNSTLESTTNSTLECTTNSTLEGTTNSTTSSIQQHPPLYTCTLCPYSTLRKDHLLRHGNQHTGKGLQFCPHCPYSTIRKEHMKRHITLHTQGEGRVG